MARNVEAHQFRTFVERSYASGDNVDIRVKVLGELNHMDGCAIVVQNVHDADLDFLDEWREFLRNLGAELVCVRVSGTDVYVDASWEEVDAEHNTVCRPSWLRRQLSQVSFVGLLTIGLPLVGVLMPADVLSDTVIPFVQNATARVLSLY